MATGKRRKTPRKFWLVRRFGRDSWLKLAEAATLEDIRRAKRANGSGRIVEAK